MEDGNSIKAKTVSLLHAVQFLRGASVATPRQQQLRGVDSFSQRSRSFSRAAHCPSFPV
jgi:hypothetical protein